MLHSVSYIITIYNKAPFLEKVIEALSKIKGNFHREFIFVNDGSTDNSLQILNKHINKLVNVTILDQENSGPAIATNKAINIASCDFLQFIDADDLIKDDATLKMLSLCEKYTKDVVIGLRGKYDFSTNNLYPSKYENHQYLIITASLKEVLAGKKSGMQNIGSTGSIIKRELALKFKGADEDCFVQDFSMSLRAAAHTEFIYLSETVAYTPTNSSIQTLSSNKYKEAYYSLITLYNFICQYEIAAAENIKYIQQRANSIIYKVNKNSFSSLLKYIKGKYFINNLSLNNIKKNIQTEYLKLAKKI